MCTAAYSMPNIPCAQPNMKLAINSTVRSLKYEATGTTSCALRARHVQVVSGWPSQSIPDQGHWNSDRNCLTQAHVPISGHSYIRFLFGVRGHLEWRAIWSSRCQRSCSHEFLRSHRFRWDSSDLGIELAGCTQWHGCAVPRLCFSGLVVKLLLLCCIGQSITVYKGWRPFEACSARKLCPVHWAKWSDRGSFVCGVDLRKCIADSFSVSWCVPPSAVPGLSRFLCAPPWSSRARDVHWQRKLTTTPSAQRQSA